MVGAINDVGGLDFSFFRLIFPNGLNPTCGAARHADPGTTAWQRQTDDKGSTGTSVTESIKVECFKPRQVECNKYMGSR